MRKSALAPLLALGACTFGQFAPGAGGDGDGGGDVGMPSSTGEGIDAPTTSGADGSSDAPADDDDDDDADSTGPMSDDDDDDDDDDDATTTGDDDDDSTSVCEGGLFWSADFSVDPTTLDVNADAINDWAMRDGNPFPAGELADGVWASQTGGALDTRPLDDFASRLLVDVRMRATSMGSQGAVFWVNMDYDVTFSPIWVRVQQQADGDQSLTLHHKTDGATSVALIDLGGLDSGFVDVSLEIDTDAGEVSLWVDGNYEGTESYASFPIGGNDDRWATLVAWGATAEFDEVTIEQCP